MKKIFTLSLIILLFVGLASALTIPHAFYGTASNDGNLVADGLVITVKLNGIEVDTCMVNDGKYGYGGNTLVIEGENNGDAITFYINGVKANEEAVFESSKVTNLDLNFQGDLPLAPACQESWTCTDWSACSNDQQTRTCTDNNNCGTTTNKPSEQQGCGDSETGTSDGGGSGGGSSGGGSSGGGGGGSSYFDDDEEFDQTVSYSDSQEIIVQDDDSNEEIMSTLVDEDNQESSGNTITGSVVGIFKNNPVPTIAGLVLIVAILAGITFWKFKK